MEKPNVLEIDAFCDTGDTFRLKNIRLMILGEELLKVTGITFWAILYMSLVVYLLL